MMIELREVSFSYPALQGVPTPVFAGFNLSIPKGRYAALMGPNGSGKSTLGKLIKGLLSPSSGQVLINGQPLPSGEISPFVGYVLSNPENQIVSSVVEEEVAFGLGNMGMDPSLMSHRVADSLRWVGMEAYRYDSPHLLSGGQQQKVVIAGILAMECEAMVMDEPTSMLDLQDRQEVLTLFKKIHEGGKRTILHITHTFEEALQAQELIYLEHGQISFRGAPEDFLTGDHGSKADQVRVPSLFRLIQGLRERGHAVPPWIRSVEDLREFLATLRFPLRTRN
jgi:energy-coupling factor transport system ATP-binding protein